MKEVIRPPLNHRDSLRLAVLICFIGSGNAGAVNHTYTTARGLVVEADSALVNGDQAVLHRIDGKFFTVTMSQLSVDDQAFVKTHGLDSVQVAPSAAIQPSPVASTPIAKTSVAPAPPVTAVDQPWRLEIRTSSGKSSRVSRRDSDDRIVRSQYTISVTNREVTRHLEGGMATLVVFGRSVIDNKLYKVLAKEEWPVSVEAHKTLQLDGKEFETVYDDSNSIRSGYRLHGFVFAIRDSTGKLIATDSSSPTMQKVMESALPLTLGATVDPDMKPRTPTNDF